MQALELILILLAAAAVLNVIAERLLVPLPALLVLGGLLLAVTPGLPRVELDPGVVFLIFVPPLLYWAALTTSYRDFRRNLRSITLLGVGLVLTTMSIVAWIAHATIPELTWGSAFVLGAIISPPDAIAVTSITRRLEIPHNIVVILEGESLVNDATAFVAYRMAVAAVVAGTFSFWQAGLRFIWTGAGGIALGLAMGWLIVRIHRILGRAPVVENTISLLTPFAVFIPAERLGLSSVLAVVATGLYLSRQGPKIISAGTRLQGQAMWKILNFILEGLIFIFIGLALPVIRRTITGYSIPMLIRYALLLSVVLIVVRIVWMFPGAYLPRLIRRRWLGKLDRYPSWRGVLFAGWAGVRGGDSLVIALALPILTGSGQPFPGRNLIIFLTFAIILVTLVLQGLTLRPIILLLKLKVEGEDDAEEAQARLKSARAGLKRLNQLADKSWATASVVNDLRERYEHRTHRLGADNPADDTRLDQRNTDAYRRLRLAMINAERAKLIQLRDRGEISDDVMRRIQRDLDFEEVLLSEAGESVAPAEPDDGDRHEPSRASSGKKRPDD